MSLLLTTTASVSLIGFACTPVPGEVQEGPSPQAHSSDSSELHLDDRVALVDIRIRPTESLPHADETRGLIGVLFERTLAELPGVVPTVEGTPAAPGLAGWNDPEAVKWKLEVADLGDRDRVDLQTSLCIDPSACVTATATGARNRMEAVVVAVTSSVARQLGHPLPRDLAANFAAPISVDEYAVLMTGRAAAVLYGFQTVETDNYEDRHRDPPLRAVFIDPSIQVAQWILGRVRFARGNLGDAQSALSVAASLQPTSIVANADLARVFTDLGKLGAAAEAWSEVTARDSTDPRFRIPKIEFSLLSNQPNQAEGLLGSLPSRYSGSPKVAELRVSVAHALGRQREEDEWLALWQERAPMDPEPVEQRVRHAIRRRAYPEAITLSMELEQRGRQKIALELRLVAAMGVGDYQLAQSAAEALGDAGLAERIQARLELETRTSTRSRILRMAHDPSTLLVRAEVRLEEGKVYAALSDAEHVLAMHPWSPEALSLKARAHEQRGELTEAKAARARLSFVDPSYVEPAVEQAWGAPPRTEPGPAQARPQSSAGTPGQTKSPGSSQDGANNGATDAGTRIVHRSAPDADVKPIQRAANDAGIKTIQRAEGAANDAGTKPTKKAASDAGIKTIKSAGKPSNDAGTMPTKKAANDAGPRASGET